MNPREQRPPRPRGVPAETYQAGQLPQVRHGRQGDAQRADPPFGVERCDRGVGEVTVRRVADGAQHGKRETSASHRCALQVHGVRPGHPAQRGFRFCRRDDLASPHDGVARIAAEPGGERRVGIPPLRPKHDDARYDQRAGLQRWVETSSQTERDQARDALPAQALHGVARALLGAAPGLDWAAEAARKPRLRGEAGDDADAPAQNPNVTRRELPRLRAR